MSALSPQHLEALLAHTLERATAAEASATAASLRALAAEDARDVALEERDAAIARDQAARRAGSDDLRHNAAQASVELLNFAHSLKAAGRPVMAQAAIDRAEKLVKALRP